jgi:hypothetical protein
LDQLLDGATQPASAKPPLPPQRYGHSSNVTPFDFIERDVIARAILRDVRHRPPIGCGDLNRKVRPMPQMIIRNSRISAISGSNREKVRGTNCQGGRVCVWRSRSLIFRRKSSRDFVVEAWIYIKPLSVGDLDGLTTLIDAMFMEMTDAAYYPDHLIDQYRQAYQPAALTAKLGACTVLALGEFNGDRLIAFLIANCDEKQNLYLEWIFVSARYSSDGGRGTVDSRSHSMVDGPLIAFGVVLRGGKKYASPTILREVGIHSSRNTHHCRVVILGIQPAGFSGRPIKGRRCVTALCR